MKKFTTITLLFMVAISFGQRKSAADKYFKEFAYIKSAELYEQIYNKGDSTQLVLSRLGDANYYNNNTIVAEKWYEKLFTLYKNQNISLEYYFKYAQTLKSNGKYNESDAKILELKDQYPKDSRIKDLIANENYLSQYTNKKPTFVNIHNVSINTEYSDYGIFISKGNLFFSSTRPAGDLKKNRLYKWNKQPFLNIYQAKDSLISLDEDLNVLDLKEVSKLNEINSRYHDASAIITSNGKTMYFTRDNYDGKKLKTDKKGTAHLKIFSATKEGNRWVNIKELSFNNDDYSIGHPALSIDEKQLYFVSNMPGGFGATDIYKVQILENNEFGTPINLGKKINTEGREMFPTINEKGILYFSSDGHIGLGLLDIFKSKIETNSYSKPINLGTPINSNKDDFSYVLDKDKDGGYFSSNRTGGKGDDDIYSFKIYHCDEFLEGIVYDALTKERLPAANVKLLDATGKVIRTVTSNELGYYSFGKVDCSKEYTVVAEKLNYTLSSKEVYTKEKDQLVVKIDLELTPLIIASQIVINPIYFDFDKWNIREDAEYELEKIVTVMNNNPQMIIKIESHTDSRGINAYNKTLSDKRAKSTKDYLLLRGINPLRIESAIGYGEEQLLNDCTDANSSKCSKEEHELNRRSYFYIVKNK